jgi:hypothetical protein
LYASGECRHLFVNLFLTLVSLFLILKDLQRKRLAVRLTGASARSNPWYCEEKYRMERHRRGLRGRCSGPSPALIREAGIYLTDFSASQ